METYLEQIVAAVKVRQNPDFLIITCNEQNQFNATCIRGTHPWLGISYNMELNFSSCTSLRDVETTASKNGSLGSHSAGPQDQVDTAIGANDITDLPDP
ncbi:hypothetical protein A0H81_11486 [Grifola frondosa]|uniref:Uncharacterized protein n=1 Tax=Grifola frondosa TaxID=5627 RepID=A0A1C7LWL0_GRIFR|nr:hypothetical protein A0H81_11486 [Grifola frondosa]